MRWCEKALKPASRRALVGWIQERYKVSTARACHLAQLSRAAYYRKSLAKDQTALRRRTMDFVHDQLFDGRPFRMLTVVEQLSRDSPLIEVDFSRSGQKVHAALDRRLAP